MRRILAAFLLTLAVVALGMLGGCHEYVHVGYGGYYGHGYDGGHHGGDHHNSHHGSDHHGRGRSSGGHCDY